MDPRDRTRPGGGAARSVAARLVADVASESTPPELVAELEAWVGGSARARAFVEANSSKIRRKLREARDVESVRDVRAELALALRLAADPQATVAFEAYGATRGGPDLTIEVRGRRLNLEVTRRRGPADAAAVLDAVVAKLRQLPPAVPNILVVAVEDPVSPADLDAAIRALRARVEARDPAVLARLRVERPKEFYERFLRLGAVVAWCEAGPAGERAIAWPNPSARLRPDAAVLAGGIGRLAA